MATFAACPFATHAGFSCSLWHQDAAAAAVCAVNLGSRGGKGPAFPFLSAEDDEAEDDESESFTNPL